MPAGTLVAAAEAEPLYVNPVVYAEVSISSPASKTSMTRFRSTARLLVAIFAPAGALTMCYK